VTEVILDLNLSPRVADAERVLEAFATRPGPSA
jgi:hypothetical protein